MRLPEVTSLARRPGLRGEGRAMPTNMISLAIVPLVVWIGVVAYLFVIDRRLARLEADKETDGL